MSISVLLCLYMDIMSRYRKCYIQMLCSREIGYMSKIIFLFLLSVLLSGCISLPNKPPVESDLIGEWVSVGALSYSKLKYYGNGEGVLIFSSDQESELFELSNFSVLEYEFTIRIADASDEDDEEEPEMLFGSILGDYLQLRSEDEEDEIKLWYIREEKLKALKESIEETLAIYETKKHNNQLKSDAASGAP